MENMSIEQQIFYFKEGVQGDVENERSIAIRIIDDLQTENEKMKERIKDIEFLAETLLQREKKFRIEIVKLKAQVVELIASLKELMLSYKKVLISEFKTALTPRPWEENPAYIKCSKLLKALQSTEQEGK